MIKNAVYMDRTKSIDERVDDLIGRMTTEEKLQQLSASGVNNLSEFAKRAERCEDFYISGTFVFNEFSASDFNKVQRYFVEKTRLGIPCLLAGENTHGVYNPHATIFPTSGCMASTFDETLVQRMAESSAEEAAQLGIRQVYAPNVDIVRDARWGRMEESFSEDAYLSSRMATAYIRGVQSKGVSATAKHYIAYGIGEGGLNLAPAHMGELDIRNDMLPVFEACVNEGVWSVMPSYNEIDGVPVHASRHWMVDVLREELKFDGMVVTDYGATNMLKNFHCINDSACEIGKIILANQVDFEAGEAFGYGKEFKAAALKGDVSMKEIDSCVRNILKLKFRVGLFENPYIPEVCNGRLHTESNIELSREIAEKGIVLLKNSGVLPISGKKKVGIFGCNANVNQLGNYIYYSLDNDCVSGKSKSLAEVFASEYSGEVVFAKGCDYVEPDNKICKEAVKLAESCDIIFLALGDNSAENAGGAQQTGISSNARKVAITSGEGYDMHFVELPQSQIDLFNEMKALGKPIVLILFGGRAHAITEQLPHCDAVLFAFGAGEEGSQALYNILTGKVCPSGKLPISFPRSTGHIPCFYNHKKSARGRLYLEPGSVSSPGRDYVLDSPEALFPFGFGLSYTEFKYSNLNVSVQKDCNVNVSVDVKNVGNYEADESVLLFISCHYREVTPEIKKLVRFKRVHLKCGENMRVDFTLSSSDFTYYGRDMKIRIAYSDYDFLVGNLKQTAKISEK